MHKMPNGEVENDRPPFVFQRVPVSLKFTLIEGKIFQIGRLTPTPSWRYFVNLRERFSLLADMIEDFRKDQGPPKDNHPALLGGNNTWIKRQVPVWILREHMM